MIGYRRIGRMIVLDLGVVRFVRLGEQWAVTLLGRVVGAGQP